MLKQSVSWAWSLGAVCAAGAAALGASWSASAQAADPSGEAPVQRLNLVLFLADDLGWQDTSVPMLRDGSAVFQNTFFRTPHLERFAERAVVFSDAYAPSSVCTPSRVAIMTGLNPAETRVTWWTYWNDQRQGDGTLDRDRVSPPLWAYPGLQPFGPETLADKLSDQGYRTLFVGKAHFGAEGTPGEDPLTLGFDANVGGGLQGTPGSYLGTENYADDPANPGAGPRDVPHLEAYHGTDTWLDDALATEAIKLIDAAHEADEPFFLWFAPYGVHTPFTADERFAPAYRAAGAQPTSVKYGSMVEAMDDAFGRLVDHLESIGELEHTVIVFTSDNGGFPYPSRGWLSPDIGPGQYNAPLRGGKASAYEGGTRVPLLVAGPGVTPRRVTSPVVGTRMHDLLLEFAGVEEDGSWRGFLAGDETAEPAAPPILMHVPHRHNADDAYGAEPSTWIRVGDWKLIWFWNAQRYELYDLANDVGETTNLASANPAKLRAMAAMLRSQMQLTDAQPPIVRETGEQDALPPSR